MVAKRDYSATHMQNDYELLADTSRIVDNAEYILNSVTGDDKGGIEPRYRRLIQFAKTRDIQLRIMPKGMARHNRNTSQVKSAPKSRVEQCGLQGTQLIFWHLDVHFVGTSLGMTQQVKIESCAEDTLVEYIAKGALSSLLKRAKRRKLNTRINERDVISLYEDANYEDLTLFLQNEYTIMPDGDGATTRNSTGMNRFCELDQNETLLSTLKGRCLIEFPVLYVAHKKNDVTESLRKALLGVFERPDQHHDSSSDSNDSSDLASDGETKVEDQVAPQTSN